MTPLYRHGTGVRFAAVGLACGLILGLGGCADPKKALGLGKRSPDEFTVVTRAPLSLPPEFALRPPQPGAQRPQELGPVDAARQSVFAPSGSSSTPTASAPPIGPTVAPAPRVGVAATPPDSAAPPVPRSTVGATQGPSTGETALLSRAGTERVTPNIRTVVNEETTRMAEAERPFIDRLIFWKEPLEAQSDVVNPTRETQRLQDNAALGKPPNEGEVPIIRRKTPSLFERLF
jgi:hypothetical protein